MQFLVALFILTVAVGGKNAGAVHHVVGDDRASDSSAVVSPWFSGQVFRVGDSLLFRYSSPQETIVELGSPEEFHACDLTNPIRMYTDGVNKIPLEEEGTRYFVSGSLEKCKSGSKLPVHVNPNQYPEPSSDSPPYSPYHPEPEPDTPFHPEPEPVSPFHPDQPEPYPGIPTTPPPPVYPVRSPPPPPVRTPPPPPSPERPSASSSLNLNPVLFVMMLFGCFMRLF